MSQVQNRETETGAIMAAKIYDKMYAQQTALNGVLSLEERIRRVCDECFGAFVWHLVLHRLFSVDAFGPVCVAGVVFQREGLLQGCQWVVYRSGCLKFVEFWTMHMFKINLTGRSSALHLLCGCSQGCCRSLVLEQQRK